MNNGVKLTLLIATLFIAACSSSARIGSLVTLPLPSTTAGDCCWQALQALDINSGGEKHALQAALALTPTDTAPQLTLVLLDPLGRRLLSVSDNNDPHQEKRTEQQQAAGIETTLPGRFLLAAVYLAYWPDSSWKKALTNSDWYLDSSPNGRTLYHRQQAIISVTSTELHGPNQGQVSVLQHHLKALTVTISTRQRENL